MGVPHRVRRFLAKNRYPSEEPLPLLHGSVSIGATPKELRENCTSLAEAGNLLGLGTEETLLAS